MQPLRASWISQAVDLYSAPLTRYANSLSSNLEEARDAVQDAFLALCRLPAPDGREPAPPDREPPEGWKAWLYTVCRNRVLDRRRKESRLASLPDDEMLAESHPTEPAEVCDREYLLACLNALPSNQGDVIRLKFLGGHSYREISQITGLSEGNVGFLIHTGMKTLRKKLEKESSRS